MYSLSNTIKILAPIALMAWCCASFANEQANNTPVSSPETLSNEDEQTLILDNEGELALALNENYEATDTILSKTEADEGISTQSCPNEFYAVKLPDNGKLCQVFAADLPASMIFFVPESPAQVIEFYQKDQATYSITRQVKDRFMMQSGDKNTTLIISSDGQGTQVDVLVKTSAS